MPFDMRHLRFPITYHCPPDAEESQRKFARDDLSKKLENALRAVLRNDAGPNASNASDASKLAPFVPRGAVDSRGRFKQKGATIGVAERSYDEKTRLIKLSPNPLMWLRVMPTIDPKKEWSIDEIRENAARARVLLPLSRGWSGYSFMRASDAFGIFPAMGDGQDDASAALMIFTNGEIWSVDAYFLEAMSTTDRNSIPLKEDYFVDSLEEYGALLAALGIAPPFRWMAGMENLSGRGIFVPVKPGQFAMHTGTSGYCLEDVVASEGLFSPADSAALAL
jgi:hypothetical protein